MLVPGGKALVLNLSKVAFQTNLIDGANEATVQKKIDQIDMRSRAPHTTTDKQGF